MWSTVVIWATKEAGPWLLQNGKYLGWPIALVVMVLWVRTNGQLAECRKPAQVVQAQSVTGTAKASSSGKVLIQGREAMPCPPDKICPKCPDAQVDFGSSAEAELKATQAQVAKLGDGQGNKLGLWLGAGHLEQPYISIGLDYQRFSVEGLRSLEAWGVKGSYRIMEFTF